MLCTRTQTCCTPQQYARSQHLSIAHIKPLQKPGFPCSQALRHRRVIKAAAEVGQPKPCFLYRVPRTITPCVASLLPQNHTVHVLQKKETTVFGDLVDGDAQIQDIPEPGQQDFWEGEKWEVR